MRGSQARLDYLEGLRGLAALYVVVHHVAMELIFGPERTALPAWLSASSGFYFLDRHAVGCFIVLSGYCLMLPIVRGEGRLQGGVGGFLRRRARRILPPYFAAVGLSLLVIRLVPGMGTPHGVRWDMVLPAFTPGVLLSHALLLHNLRAEWIFTIDYPLWSVATEWQIYLAFPLLLALWRRLGSALVVVLAFVAGCALHFSVPLFPLKASPWYLGLFALGMGAASLNFGPLGSRLSALRSATRLAVLVAVEVALWKLDGALLALPDGPRLAVQDLVRGAMAAALVALCTAELQSGSARPLTGLLGTKPLLGLGGFAYGLYLAHAPVLAWLHLRLLGTALSTEARCAALFALGIPLALAASYAFFLLFERPLLARRTAPESTAPLTEALPPIQ